MTFHIFFDVSLGYCHWFYYGFLCTTTLADDEGVAFMSLWGVVDSRCQSFVSLAFLFVKATSQWPSKKMRESSNHHRGKGMRKNKNTPGSSKCVKNQPFLSFFTKRTYQRQKIIFGRSRSYLYIILIYIYIIYYIKIFLYNHSYAVSIYHSVSRLQWWLVNLQPLTIPPRNKTLWRAYEPLVSLKADY